MRHRGPAVVIVLLVLASGPAGMVAVSGAASTAVAAEVPLAGGLSQPYGVAVDNSGDIYVADSGNNRVVEITPSGTSTVVGSGFGTPKGVAVDNSGDVFVADTGNNEVVEITPSGSGQTIGSGLLAPAGVAVDNSGDIYVADSGNNRVVEFTPAGDELVRGSGLSLPSGVAVDGSGDVYVADTGNNRVVEISPSGAETPVGTGLLAPFGVAVDGRSDVFVADTFDNRVVEITPLGTETAIGTGWNFPTGVASRPGDQLVVADFGRGRIVNETFGADLSPLPPANNGQAYGPVQLRAQLVTPSASPEVTQLHWGKVTLPKCDRRHHAACGLALPAGLRLSPTGVVSGTPRLVNVPIFTAITVRVTEKVFTRVDGHWRSTSISDVGTIPLKVN